MLALGKLGIDVGPLVAGLGVIGFIVGISCGADIGKAKDCLLSALKASDLVLNDLEPMVEVLEMGDSSVNLVVLRPWCKTSDYWPTYFAMSRAIKEALDNNDVEIPFPQMDVHHYGLPKTDATAMAGHAATASS